ncbi:hypothetical protein TTHERM_01085620 (macronuclear) [Tetrahymena thermophila SB210]|uniref:Transmembrane protein n=1 Tax=Tetrahymena thermophila (strain SB210) TaxID=312017 RepID=Q22BQ8_TETTS|nr:hypothetical protein TTHERM_01085620 [Tetrahymena thermophila SB210]EAR82731.2 hypothetical protein TTHERM_01085620 [Tetrahymena thermophila SB210]|eukprot:XP_001030394.2 hypothetical protein TTHERM_01085620 [Tetrahymena thermophila SB210]
MNFMNDNSSLNSLRQSQIYLLSDMFDLLKCQKMMSFTTINIQINLFPGSFLDFNYFNPYFQNTFDTFNFIGVFLSTLSSNTFQRAIIYSDFQLYFTNICTIYISQISFIVNFGNYTDKTLPFIKSNSIFQYYFFVDFYSQKQQIIQFNYLQFNLIPFFLQFSYQQYVDTNGNIDEGFFRFEIENGQLVQIVGLNYTNKYLNQGSYLIKLNTPNISLSIDDIFIQNCLMNNFTLNLIQKSNVVQINQLNLVNNTIINQNLQSQGSAFISCAACIISNSIIISNNFQDTSIIQKQNDYSAVPLIQIKNITITKNQINFNNSQLGFFIDLNLPLKLDTQNLTVQIDDLTIKKNYLIQKNFQKSSDNIVSRKKIDLHGQDLEDLIIDLDQDFQQFNWIKVTNVNNFFLTQLSFIDNDDQSLLTLSKVSNLLLQDIEFSNTFLKQDAQSGYCFAINCNQLFKIQIKNVTIKNKLFYNSYAFLIDQPQEKIDINNNYSLIQISNFNVSNTFINLQKDSKYPFVKIASTQKTKAILQNINFENSLIHSEDNLFYSEYSPFLLIDMPQSVFYFNNMNVRSIYNKSPYSIVYLNVDNILLDSSKFDRNTYEYNPAISQQNKGYLTLRCNLCNITNNTFQNSISKDGSSINIYQNEDGSQLFINNSTFKNLISLSGGGGAILVLQSTLNSFMIIKGCILQNILLKSGGAIQQLNFKVQQPSIINLQECQIINVISQNEGSFITSSNVFISIQDSNLTAKFPLNNIDFDKQQQDFLLTFQTIGSVFYITQSNLQLNNFNLFDYNISYFNITQISVPAFLYSFGSSINVNNSNFTNSTFNQAGFFEIYSSFVNITNSLFDNLIYYDDNQQNYNKDDILQKFVNSQPYFLTNERETGFVKSSMILIKQNSQFIIQNNNFIEIFCLSQSNCFGSALGIIQSEGNIYKSIFSGCVSFNNGGALSIQNAFSQISINSCQFEDNISLQKGGAIYLSQLTSKLFISHTSIVSNIASYGGALFQFQDSQSNFTKENKTINVIFNNSIVQKNYASQFGSGLYLNSFITRIQGNSQISNILPGQKFGINFFYQPAKLSLNLEKTKLFNQNQTIDIQYFSQNFTFKVKNQVSGYQIPTLVFELHDQEGRQITDEYTKAQQAYMHLNLQKQQDRIDQQLFFLILPNENILFSDNQFILREITIEGIPESTIQLLVTLQLYRAAKINDLQLIGFPQYYLQIELRRCIEGEIYIPKRLLVQNLIFKVYECSKCKEGSYSLVVPKLNDEPLAWCKKCLEMMTCLGGNQIQLNQGYWRQNKSTDSVYLCFNNPRSCLGGMNENLCDVGYLGPLCEECDLKQGYYKSGKYQCKKLATFPKLSQIALFRQNWCSGIQIKIEKYRS